MGEVNVVAAIKETNAIIGGEGNGGIIYPASHCGRDAVVGTALFLTQLAMFGEPVSALRAGYPNWFMSKDKLELPPVDVDAALKALVASHPEAEVNTVDGVKFDLEEGLGASQEIQYRAHHTGLFRGGIGGSSRAFGNPFQNGINLIACCIGELNEMMHFCLPAQAK